MKGGMQSFDMTPRCAASLSDADLAEKRATVGVGTKAFVAICQVQAFATQHMQTSDGLNVSTPCNAELRGRQWYVANEEAARDPGRWGGSPTSLVGGISTPSRKSLDSIAEGETASGSPGRIWSFFRWGAAGNARFPCFRSPGKR